MNINNIFRSNQLFILNVKHLTNVPMYKQILQAINLCKNIHLFSLKDIKLYMSTCPTCWKFHKIYLSEIQSVTMVVNFYPFSISSSNQHIIYKTCI